MGKIVQVRIGMDRLYSFYNTNDVECQRNDLVILELDRGTDCGEIISDPDQTLKGQPDKVTGKIIRKVTEGDLNQIQNNKLKARDAINTCIRKISDRKLAMQLLGAEYTFDCSKIIFYFTAEGRVDFRNLVKDLAKIFRVRIELKQVGVRDRAKLVGGYGVCGRDLCCSSFLKFFHPLSIRMAKDQALPLNPSRISGSCGRIKCCMAYEFMVYRDLAKNLPRVGDKVSTQEGKGRVIDINILKRTALVDWGEGKVSKIEYPRN